jgi:hypothetical protein
VTHPVVVDAVRELRNAGHSVEPGDFGLWLVNGRELTEAQVVHLTIGKRTNPIQVTLTDTSPEA